jgi:hypothetical protein
MNFNFNFKDILGAARASIDRLASGCDLNHMAELAS